jgi:hypothetical protein
VGFEPAFKRAKTVHALAATVFGSYRIASAILKAVMLVLLMGEIMNYAVYMGSGVYVSISPKTGSGIQKFIRGTQTGTQTEKLPHTPTFIF